MTLVVVHNVLYIFLDFFSYFNKREVSILRTFVDHLDLADQTFPSMVLRCFKCCFSTSSF